MSPLSPRQSGSPFRIWAGIILGVVVATPPLLFIAEQGWTGWNIFLLVVGCAFFLSTVAWWIFQSRRRKQAAQAEVSDPTAVPIERMQASMDPMNHPDARHQRLWFIFQIVGASIMLVGLPIIIFVLQKPPREHELLTIVLIPLLIGLILLGIREIRRLPHVYRFEDTEEEAE
ncbi:hypothetical protein [uncultured Arthrobacter sp.]|uniref:hypothetical protein n=1 Tax=uncultured Arthrobacter sp. TaxID=114050 RepID=UPI0026259119|nr:hypothetical protein [uncultured Arthrobacter sp.]